MISQMNKMLYRMIRNSIGQFFAVVMMIIAGIVILVAMNMTSVNMANTVKVYYDDYKFADLFIQIEGIPAQKVKELEALDGVSQAEGRVVLEVPVITDDLKERVNARLITSKGERDSLNRCFLLEGRWMKDNSKEIVVLNQFAEARQIQIGDKITIQAGGMRYTLNVVGIAASPEFIYLIENVQSIMPNPSNYGVFYISEAFGGQLTGIFGNYNDVLIGYSEGTKGKEPEEESLIKTLEDRLRHYGVQQMTKQKDQLSNNMIQTELTQIGRMSSSIPIIFISVAGLVLMMMLGRMVKRDRIKIGILKAIGYGNIQIVSHYMKYAVICGLIGGFAGVALGMICSGGMTQLYLLYFNIPLLQVDFYPAVVAEAILYTGVFCAVSGIIGARGILKIMPAASMQSESPKLGKRIFLEQIPIFWKRLSFSWKMVWRNVLRNKKRSSFVLMGIMLTYAMMLFTTSMPGAVDEMMNKHYQEFQKMDYIIGFRTPVKANAINDLRHLAEIEHMEGKLEYAFEFENGNRKQTVSLIGIEPKTAFYTFTNPAGQGVSLPEKGLLVSENLAKNLKIKKGDIVKLNTFIPGRQDAYIEVREIIKQSLGMNAYMNINEMGQKLMEKNVVNGVYLNSADQKINEELVGVSNIASVMSVTDTRNVFLEYMTMMFISIGFMVVFSGILGFCVVYNATSIAIGERELEFSSLRVLGFGTEEIFRIIVKENRIVTILGILAGIPVGIYMLSASASALSVDLYTIHLNPNMQALVAAAVFTMLFVWIAQLATYHKIKKLDLLQALKSRQY